MNYANQYVPTVRWVPSKEVSNYDRPKDLIPAKSSYQADFESPTQSRPPAVNPNCKAVAVQLLMQHDKRLAERYEKQQKATMQSIQTHKKNIEQSLAHI